MIVLDGVRQTLDINDGLVKLNCVGGIVVPDRKVAARFAFCTISAVSCNIGCKNERHIMHLLLSPVLGSAIWIGGGSVGLLLVIIVVVLFVR